MKFTYSVKVHLIIKAIEDQYDLKFSDDFFDLIMDLIHKKLYMFAKKRKVFEM